MGGLRSLRTSEDRRWRQTSGPTYQPPFLISNWGSSLQTTDLLLPAHHLPIGTLVCNSVGWFGHRTILLWFLIGLDIQAGGILLWFGLPCWLTLPGYLLPAFCRCPVSWWFHSASTADGWVERPHPHPGHDPFLPGTTPLDGRVWDCGKHLQRRQALFCPSPRTPIPRQLCQPGMPLAGCCIPRTLPSGGQRSLPHHHTPHTQQFPPSATDITAYTFVTVDYRGHHGAAFALPPTHTMTLPPLPDGVPHYLRWLTTPHTGCGVAFIPEECTHPTYLPGLPVADSPTFCGPSSHRTGLPPTTRGYRYIPLCRPPCPATGGGAFTVVFCLVPHHAYHVVARRDYRTGCCYPATTFALPCHCPALRQ